MIQNAGTAMLRFFKKEPMLLIAGACAVISMLFVPPCEAYAGYIDWKVLGLLFCLMAVVSGLQNCNIFGLLSARLLKLCRGIRLLRLVLVLLPFFTSMCITNDVALITFVPFAIALLSSINRKDQLISVVVLQTIAANLGSMALPIGNPQSLYLFTRYQITMDQYFCWILPLVFLSLLGLVTASLAVKNEPIQIFNAKEEQIQSPIKIAVYLVLFILSMLCVFRILDYRLTVMAVAIIILIMDWHTLLKVDYFLLLTFICFFIFSGNLGEMEAVKNILTSLLKQDCMLTGALASQVISNVPAAVLLSAFTENGRGLLLGTNIGGLGTIIASLASLISFKFYLREPGSYPGKYMLQFTLWNLAGFLLLYGAAIFLPLY